MKEFIYELLENIIDKWEDMKMPKRLVMIKQNYCYNCKIYTDVNYYHTDTFDGKYNYISWTVCNKCDDLVELAHKIYCNKLNFLTYSKSAFLEGNNYKFLRKSKDKKYLNIQSNGIFNDSFGDMIHKSNNRIVCKINWLEETNNHYYKFIPLSNIIFCNRNIFTYKFNHNLIKNINGKWLQMIKKEYDYANEWYIFLLILERLNNPLILDVIDYIYYFWNNIYKIY